MEIIQTTSITLSNEEKEAVQTLIDAYTTCVCNECFECNDCPLYVNKQCIGQLCELAKEGKHENY